MPSLPVNSASISHQATALQIVGRESWASTTWDVYCPVCMKYLHRALRSQLTAIACAVNHRLDYGLAIPKEYQHHAVFQPDPES